jgi:predicted TIM-barrel fold metal-dependent hydrolase
MFIDVHVHPAFYEPIRGDAAREESRHALLGIYQNGSAPLEHVFNQMRCASLDRLCLLAQDYSASASAPVSNEEVRKLVDLAPDKFIGFASIDPSASGCLEKLEYAFAELKLRALKLHPARQRFYPGERRLDPVYDICEKYDRPVLFHAGLSLEPDSLAKYARPAEFEELAYRRPKLRICLAHFGWPWVQETAMLMLKYPNVYADTALLYFDSAKEFYFRVFTRDLEITWLDRSLRHQVMFGSDNPRFEQIRMAGALGDLGLRDSTVDLIKGRNAIEFLGGIA